MYEDDDLEEQVAELEELVESHMARAQQLAIEKQKLLEENDRLLKELLQYKDLTPVLFGTEGEVVAFFKDPEDAADYINSMNKIWIG